MGWEDVCFPKAEEALGLRRLLEWNIASVLRHIWVLYAKSGSIWVALVKLNLLKGTCFWSLKIPQGGSWSWKKLLKLRSLAKQFLRFKVSDGSNIFLCLDSWHPDGVLLDKFSFRVVCDARSSIEAKLSSVVVKGKWVWLNAWSDFLVYIQSQLFKVVLEAEERAIWVTSKGESFTCRDTWDSFRSMKPLVDWCDLVWFHLAIPRQAFFLWLALKNSLSTGDCLLCWL